MQKLAIALAVTTPVDEISIFVIPTRPPAALRVIEVIAGGGERIGEAIAVLKLFISMLAWYCLLQHY